MKKSIMVLVCVGVLLFAGAASAGLDDGLVGSWSFDECNVLDSSGNWNTGYFYGAPVCVPGICGNAMSYAGVTNRQYAYIPNSASLSFTDNYTFTLWFNIDSYTSMDGWGRKSEYGVQALLTKAGDRNGLTIRVFRNQATGLMYVNAGNGRCCTAGGRGISTVAGIGLHEWHMITFTHGNGEVKLYLDGELQGTMSSADFNMNQLMKSQRLQLGIGQSAVWYPLDGMLDDVRAYGRVLSDEEVMKLYRSCLTLSVDIDIKPGSDPNCINHNGKGVIPVAILGTADLDVTDIDAGSISLDGMYVKTVGKDNKLVAGYEDVNADGYLDLVVKIDDTDGIYQDGDDTGTVTGMLLDGTPIEGTDSICLVP